MADILYSAVMCIDASLRTAEEMAEDGDNGLANRVNELIQEFKDKYEITNPDMGNDDSWETATDKQFKDSKTLDYNIMLLVWDHIKELMLDCGAGDIVREVLAREILNIPLSCGTND